MSQRRERHEHEPIWLRAPRYPCSWEERAARPPNFVYSIISSVYFQVSPIAGRGLRGLDPRDRFERKAYFGPTQLLAKGAGGRGAHAARIARCRALQRAGNFRRLGDEEQLLLS